ncbi:tail fiber assembly protein [Sodalis endosymbiont of Spalangia cameroni]|uniref:tail fiber assembly protein n=1 Tax=Sodalis praecaptivus TaxID=1239307 RepID=UPI0031F8632A
MAILYSPSENSFYCTDAVFYAELPSDRVEITENLWQELLSGQSEGKVITPNGSDAPYLSDPKIDHVLEARNKRAELMAAANVQVAPLQDAVDLGIATEKEIAAYNKWRKYRVTLMRIDTSVAPNIVWPKPPE